MNFSVVSGMNEPVYSMNVWENDEVRGVLWVQAEVGITVYKERVHELVGVHWIAVVCFACGAVLLVGICSGIDFSNILSIALV